MEVTVVAMSDTTTVRVRRRTHAALAQEAATSSCSTDEVIDAGLKALQRERIRRQMEQEARQVAADPADRAEVAAALRDLLGE